MASASSSWSFASSLCNRNILEFSTFRKAVGGPGDPCIKTLVKTLFFAVQMPSLYLFHFAQAHNEFRLPELASVAELYGIQYTLPEKKEDSDPNRPFMVIQLEGEEHARMLAKRCILIKYVP
jgi:hypothetical protein